MSRRPLDAVIGKKVCYLDQWRLTRRDENPYQPPECQPFVLGGNVLGHPDFRDGDYVKVSKAVAVDFDSSCVETLNTIYVLLEPLAEFMEFLKERGDTLADVKASLLRSF